MTAILRRKVAEAQRDGARGQMTALRALRLSVARAGDDLFDLALGVVAARQQRLLPDDMEGLLSDQDLLLFLECPDGETGAAALAPAAVTSIIQQQTMGVVLAQAPGPRTFTETDAAICAPLLEDVLSRAAELAEAAMDQSCFSGVRFGAKAEDMRSLHLGLRAKRYRVFWLTLDIALGKHQAEVVIVLPDTGPRDADQNDGNEAGLERVAGSPLLDVPAELEAILGRISLSVSALHGLSVGDTLSLAGHGLDDTALIARGGDLVARGRLGQIHGNRALRLMPARATPRVGEAPQDGVFDALSSTPDDDPPLQEGADPMIGDPRGSTVPGLDDDLDIDGLATLSPEDAAEQIGQLAGLSAAELAAQDPQGDLSTEGAGMPDLPQMEQASASGPVEELPLMGEFAAAPMILEEDRD